MFQKSLVFIDPHFYILVFFVYKCVLYVTAATMWYFVHITLSSVKAYHLLGVEGVINRLWVSYIRTKETERTVVYISFIFAQYIIILEMTVIKHLEPSKYAFRSISFVFLFASLFKAYFNFGNMKEGRRHMIYEFVSILQ